MRQNFRKIGIVFCAAGLMLGACGPTPSEAGRTNPVSLERLQVDMEAIASEETEGRMTGSPGYRKAADYAARRFADSGLSPGWTRADGERSFLQPVRFFRHVLGKRNALLVAKEGSVERILPGPETFVFPFPEINDRASALKPPVFIGFGIHEPELGWDDLKGLEIEGRIVLMILRLPRQLRSIRGMPEAVIDKYEDERENYQLRFRMLSEKHIAGLVGIPDQAIVNAWSRFLTQQNRFDFSAVEDYPHRARLRPEFPTMVAHKNLVDRFFGGFGYDPVSLTGKYRTSPLSGFAVGMEVDSTEQEFTCFNVIGLLPGTSPDCADEYITVSAHLDHLGRQGDHVYYGANDDASGCVAVMEAARILSESPLERPILFVLFTAEEAGHYGSLHFLAHPPVPKDQLVLSVNLEQVGSKTRTVRGLWAAGHRELGDVLERIEDRVPGLEVRFSDIDTQLSLISGSDTRSFYLEGIRSVILGSGSFVGYHTPLDRVDQIDYEHLAKVTHFLVEFLREWGRRR